jgi:crossover junction endodeoxyribonuclease RusA
VTTYRLALPYERPPAALHGNRRAHWRAEHRDKQAVRSDVTNLALAAQIPKAKHLTVELVWAPGDRRIRDEDNLWPLLKTCCDALARGRQNLIGLDLVPDDSPRYMDKLKPRIVGPDETRECGMWLNITVATPLTDEESLDA